MFIIPSLILGTALAAGTMRLTRTMMLEVLRQDYIRTAWSKGLKERVVIVRHAVKNALIPVVTLIGLQSLPILVGGSVIMENIFNLPGIGRLLLDCTRKLRDYPVVSGINLFFGATVMLDQSNDRPDLSFFGPHDPLQIKEEKPRVWVMSQGYRQQAGEPKRRTKAG